uniref:Uncharacterized protein n=1 Tax=Anguilla anguilla TaxID=7936 RepID=A0A0E9XPK5_ANGAN
MVAQAISPDQTEPLLHYRHLADALTQRDLHNFLHSTHLYSWLYSEAKQVKYLAHRYNDIVLARNRRLQDRLLTQYITLAPQLRTISYHSTRRLIETHKEWELQPRTK